MKQLIVLAALVAIMFLGNHAHAYTSVEAEVNAGNGVPTYRLFAVKPVAGPVGVFAFAVTTEGWGQAYAGIDYMPAKWLDLGLGYGVDTAGNNRRIGGYIIAFQGPFAAKYFFESEGSGEFHKSFLTYNASKSITLGVVNHKFLGNGPLAEVKLRPDLALRVIAYPDNPCVSLITSF